MTDVWLTIAALTVVTVSIKSAGPVTLGGRQPSERAFAVVSLFAPALLAALVVYQTLGAGQQGITLDARIAGVAVALAALLMKAHVAVVVLGAAAATALVRALGG